jgi:hypothetical protein
VNPNPIHRLLDDVVQTGELPSDEQIRDVITRGPAVGAKREARRQIAVAAKRIIGALGRSPGWRRRGVGRRSR